MSRVRVLAPALSLVVVAACEPEEKAQNDDTGSTIPGDECADRLEDEGSMKTEWGIGFTGEDAFDAAVAEHEVALFWSDDDPVVDVEKPSEGVFSTMNFTVSANSAVRYYVSEWVSGDTDCEDWLEVDVVVDVETTDGSLMGQFEGTLQAMEQLSDEPLIRMWAGSDDAEIDLVIIEPTGASFFPPTSMTVFFDGSESEGEFAIGVEESSGDGHIVEFASWELE